MKSCWTRASLLSARCPSDGVDEERSTRGKCAQAVAQAQRKRLFEYFDYTPYIRRDLSGSGLLIIVYKCLLLSELEDRFESQSRASRSGIALGMSPSGVFPQVVDHRLEGATIPRPIAVAQSAKQLR